MGTVLIYPYRWRVRSRLPERFGQVCRVLVRSRAMNSALVEFEDGYRVVTSRNYLRKVENMSEFKGSYLDVILNIAEDDRKCALIFLPSDLRNARIELHELRDENEQIKVEYSKSLNNLGYEIAGLKAENEKLKQSQREQAGWRRPDVEEPATWGCPECGAEDWPKYRVSCACGYRRPSSQVMNLR